MAEFNYRDAIVAGEDDSAGRQVRDLSVSFLLDTPQALWISSVARMMAARGYALTLAYGMAVVAHWLRGRRSDAGS